MTAPLVRLVGVSKFYGEIAALRRINMEICQGELLAVFGPNGAGKTTLLAVLAQLLRPSEGRIEYCSDWPSSREQRCERIGLVAHQPMLYGDLTARENLTFFANLYRNNLAGRVVELLEQLGLVEAADRTVRTFSRGMRQRLALARALLHDPELLLLDEPFSGLDRSASVWLLGLLQDLRRQQRTIVMMTHDLDLCRLASNVAILASGRVVFYGPSSDETAVNFERVYEKALASAAALPVY